MSKTPRLTSFYTTKDDAKLYYEIHGSKGPIIVLTNGLACPINHWHEQIPFFSKDYRVLTYDLRGHHKSSDGRIKKITMDLLVSDLFGIFKQAFPHDSKASFWGHSYGVPVSLKFAFLKPEMCESLVLLNGFYKNPFDEYLTVSQCVQAVEALKIFSLSAPTLSNYIWSHSSDSSLFRLIAGWSGGFNLERSKIEDLEIYSKAVASMYLPAFFNHFKAMVRYNALEDLSQIHCPGLVIHGHRDNLIPVKQNETLADELPQGQLLKIREGSHCSQLDKPYEVNQKILEFLQPKQIQKPLG